MKQIVIKAREMGIFSPGERWGAPDGIADQLIARGKAELIQSDIIKQEEKAKPDIPAQENKAEVPAETDTEKKIKKGSK